MESFETFSELILKILIVDDHQLLREGLKTMLLSFKKDLAIQLVEAESGEKALQKISRQDIDLVIIDYQLAGLSGPETIRHIKRFNPEIKVLAISNYNEQKSIEAMLNAGALGYVLKSVEPEELLSAIKSVWAGKKYYCNEVAQVLIAAAENTGSEKRSPGCNITAREMEVLIMIAREMTNEEIAKKLFLARRTIDTHRQNLLAKLKVKNTAGLVRVAIEMNLLK